MSAPQPGILLDPSGAPSFLVLRVLSDEPDVAAEVARLPGLAESLSSDEGSVTCTVAFGPDFWRRVHGEAPAELAPFPGFFGSGGQAVDTGGDLLLHVATEHRELAFDLISTAMNALGGRVEVLDDVQGFRYWDSRDLTGFIDGTENPAADERAEVALIQDEDPTFAGGSYVLAQRYVHDLAKWSTIPDDEQEKIIGRSKPDSVELDDDVRPETSHISRVVIEEDGEELEIVRHSSPYGNAREAGLFFIAYNRTRSTFDKMLANMYGSSDDGRSDALMGYSDAVTSAYFFAPSAELLSSLAK